MATGSIACNVVVAASRLAEREGGLAAGASMLGSDGNKPFVGFGDEWPSVGLYGSHDNCHDGKDGGMCKQHGYVRVFCLYKGAVCLRIYATVRCFFSLEAAFAERNS